MIQTPYAVNNIPVHTISNPVGVDAIITGIQSKLSTDLAWLTKSFGKAIRKSVNIDNGEGGVNQYDFPAVFTGNGQDLADVLALDQYNAYSFMIPQDPETVADVYLDFDETTYTRPIDLIIWFKLDKVDSAKTYDYREELKQAIKTSLANAQYSVPGSIIIEEVYDTPEEIFTGFSYEQVDYNNLTYPFGGFRFTITANYVNLGC